ncbi:unnamed protein product [Caenorhabditis auriculariae]|uniref:TOG domain-containing protein n=1 Tax=Caenorhabditis auriculariae TaxID=2777116 RepID=A0A8S1HEM2_9PELO|nr:unnamed protein product [Caenorhabditis auriculariae]
MTSLLDSLIRPLDRQPSPSLLPDDFLEMLKSPDFDVRLQTLNRAVGIVKRDDDWFNRFSKKGELFKCLDRILVDERWELQHQCIKFLVEAMPTFGGACEYCMCYVMPNLIPKLASSKITVRRIGLQAILTFLRLRPEALGSVLKMLSNYVATGRDLLAKGEVIQEVRAFFIPELIKGNWNNMMDALTKEVSGIGIDEKVGVTMAQFRVYIGTDAFAAMAESLEEPRRQRIEHLSRFFEHGEKLAAPGAPARANIKLQSGDERRLRFGIVPSVVATLISDENDTNARISGLEKLKQIMEQITAEEVTRIVPHLHSYLLLLTHVLSDLNFKVIVVGLDVVRLTVNRLKSHMEAHLHQVVSMLSKHFGNQKAVIKQLIMMTFMDLFQNTTPKSVAAALRVHLENKNSRTREEVLNILTAALMTTSPSKVNLSVVANMLVPLLIDPKRRLTVVSYMLGGKLESVNKAVREIETEQNLRGLAEAVTARIRRQLLPRIRYDGLIEYSIPPISDTAFDVSESEMANPENADLLWILNSGANDPNDRTASPVSLAGNLAIIRQQRQAGQTFDRMKSDDAIIRRQNSAVSNPNSSTNSWHTPKRHNSVADNSLDDEIPSTTSAAPNNAHHLPRKPSKEVNNNTEKLPKKSLMTRARSDSNVNDDHEEMENYPPTTSGFDERPAVASGQYSFSGCGPSSIIQSGCSFCETNGRSPHETARNIPPPASRPLMPFRDSYLPPIFPRKTESWLDGRQYLWSAQYDAPTPIPLAKKSASHHSLPITQHVPLKNVQSQPQRKAQELVKSAQNGKSKSNSKLNSAGKSPQRSWQPNNNTTTRAHSLGNDAFNVPQALKQIDSDEWSDKVDGLNMIAELSETNGRQVVDNLKEARFSPQPHANVSHSQVVAAILNECKNLRSSVSRVALVAIGTLAQNLKFKMDGELEKICVVLMNKAGDVSNAFIREDATEALNKVVRNSTPHKVMLAIISSGAKSKNNTIRASCASFVFELLDIQGSSAVLNNPSILSHLLPAIVQFSKDQTPQVRQSGRQSLCLLSGDNQFEKLIRKNAGEAEFKVVKEILGNIEKKGGIDALDSSSLSLNGTLTRVGSMRKTLRKLPDSVQLDLDEVRTELSATSWERRLHGLTRFEEMTSHGARAVATDTRLLEAFIARLSDINSKVSQQAMETFLTTLPSMSKFYSSEANLKAILNQLVLALMSHLPSKSEEHRQLAQNCLQQSVKQIDVVSLMPALGAAVRKANLKQKPFMVQILCELIKIAYKSKPKQVGVVALPLLWEALKGSNQDADNKKASTQLAKTLARLVGEKNILDYATSELDPQRRKAFEAILR